MINESDESSEEVDDCDDQEFIEDENTASSTNIEANKDNHQKISKKKGKKAPKEEFILRTGKAPLRNIPLNVGLSVFVSLL